MLNREKLVLSLKNYLFRDEFSGSVVDLAKWTKADTESKITLDGAGNLSFSGGKASPAWGDPSLVSVKSFPRQRGLTIEWQITPGAANKHFEIGWTDGSLDSGGIEAHQIQPNADGNFQVGMMPNYVVTPLAYTAVSMWAKIVCLTTGAYYYVSTDNKATWTLIWVDATVTVTPLYAFIESYNAALTASQCRVFQGSIKAPIIDSTAPAPTLTLGSEVFLNPGFETSDPPASWTGTGATTSQVADPRSGSAGSYAINIARLNDDYGSARQTVTTTAHAWYYLSGYAKVGTAAQVNLRNVGTTWIMTLNTTSTSYVYLTATGRAPSASPSLALLQTATGTQNSRVDDVSLKPITFSTLITGGGDAGSAYGIFDAACTVTNQFQAGIVSNLNSASSPTYYLHGYIFPDSINAQATAVLLKVVNGTTTELISDTTVTYVAGAKVRIVVVPGTSGLSNAQVGLYYNNLKIGSTQTVDLSAFAGTLVRGFQTNTADTVVVTANI